MFTQLSPGVDCLKSHPVLTAQIPLESSWLIQRKCQSACWRPYYWGLKGHRWLSPLYPCTSPPSTPYSALGTQGLCFFPYPELVPSPLGMLALSRSSPEMVSINLLSRLNPSFPQTWFKGLLSVMSSATVAIGLINSNSLFLCFSVLRASVSLNKLGALVYLA